MHCQHLPCRVLLIYVLIGIIQSNSSAIYMSYLFLHKRDNLEKLERYLHFLRIVFNKDDNPRRHQKLKVSYYERYMKRRRWRWTGHVLTDFKKSRCRAVMICTACIERQVKNRGTRRRSFRDFRSAIETRFRIRKEGS